MQYWQIFPSFLIFLLLFIYIKGRRQYPCFHAKCQSDVLSGWVGKGKFIMTFCVTNWFQRKSNFKRKNINKNKKLLRTHVCFPFHHGTCTRRVQVQGYLYFVTSPRKKAPDILSLYRKTPVRENPFRHIYTFYKIYFGDEVYWFS